MIFTGAVLLAVPYFGGFIHGAIFMAETDAWAATVIAE
jgi:hypothetical protein